VRVPEAPPEIAALGVSRVCFSCHGEQFTELQYNEHHRVREGVLECTSCHDPHEPATRTLLGGFKQEKCAACHTDKGGPFVFEHPASRVEGCTACHSPHGSPNRHMLAHQRVAELCFTCHATVPSFHGGANPAVPPRFGLDTQCTNCHAAIHGSNFDPFFLR
jgi:DmsE family decaheme c-type cytochrome